MKSNSNDDDPAENAREEQAYQQQLGRQIALATLFDGDAESEVAAQVRQLEVDLEQSTARHLAELRREFQERGGREASPACSRTAEVLRHAAREFDFAPDLAGLLGEVAQLIEPAGARAPTETTRRRRRRWARPEVNNKNKTGA